MTPWRARLAGWARQIRCRLGDHELTMHPTDAQEAAGDTPAVPAILRQRCLHCGHLTAGWPQDGPRYAVTQPADRTQLVLHNPRLKKCPCAACDQARLMRRARRAKVAELKRPA
jgi:hypothetical protein